MADEAFNEDCLMTKLRRHRVAKGLSQTELAKKMRVTPAAVSAWETGQSLPSAGRVPLLARLLEIPAMELTRLMVPEDDRPVVTA